jgi:hypothetical protein
MPLRVGAPAVGLGALAEPICPTVVWPATGLALDAPRSAPRLRHAFGVAPSSLERHQPGTPVPLV